MLPWPSDFLSWAFTSSLPVPLVWKVPLLPLLPDLKIQSHFLLFEKLQLSMFREKWFVSICFWTLWFGPEILKCHHYGCSLLDISLNASKEKTIWKVRKRQVQGRFFFWTNRWKEAFDCNLLFHVSALPWKSVLSLSFFFVLLSCFFCSHYPNIRPKKLTCSLQITKMRVCEVLLIYTLCRSCPQYFFSTSIFRNGERLHFFIVPGVCASKPQNKWPDETPSFSSAYYVWFSVQQQIIQQSKN